MFKSHFYTICCVKPCTTKVKTRDCNVQKSCIKHKFYTCVKVCCVKLLCVKRVKNQFDLGVVTLFFTFIFFKFFGNK